MTYTRSHQLRRFLQSQGITDEAVLSVMGEVPRELFIPEAMRHQAYDNNALPIGSGQTISQPYIVARMTELLQLTPQSKVLEIGTGSGYQTAILASLVDHVYSMERIKSLQWGAKRRLRQLDLYNISTKHADGWQGWASQAPFDAIIVTAAASQIPSQLLTQLKDGGRLVLPVGEQSQQLVVVTNQVGQYHSQQIEPVRFVPLVAGDLA
ncbi:MAG: protein-L-isoaspartate(D-aspartate) O-methyltransferase [Vibrio sp.]